MKALRLFGIAALCVLFLPLQARAGDWVQKATSGGQWVNTGGYAIAFCNASADPALGAPGCYVTAANAWAGTSYCTAFWFNNVEQSQHDVCFVFDTTAPDPDPDACAYSICVADAMTLNWAVIGVWGAVFGIRFIGRSARP